MLPSETKPEEQVQPGWKVAVIIFGSLFGIVALVLIAKWLLGA